MTAFQCKIVVKKKPSGLNWTRSEKLYNFGALGFIGGSTFIYFLNHIHPKLSEIDTLNGQNPCFIEGFVS